MTDVTVRSYRSKARYLITCPECSTPLCDGHWHVILNDNSNDYVVGEIRRCTNPECRVRIRCRTAFPSQGDCEARVETVEIDVHYSGSVGNWELFNPDFDSGSAVICGLLRHTGK